MRMTWLTYLINNYHEGENGKKYIIEVSEDIRVELLFEGLKLKKIIKDKLYQRRLIPPKRFC